MPIPPLSVPASPVLRGGNNEEVTSRRGLPKEGSGLGFIIVQAGLPWQRREQHLLAPEQAGVAQIYWNDS